MITLNGFQYLKARGYYTKHLIMQAFVQLISTYKSAVIFPECFSAENTTKMTALYINKIYSLLSNIAICLVAAIKAPT